MRAALRWPRCALAALALLVGIGLSGCGVDVDPLLPPSGARASAGGGADAGGDGAAAPGGPRDRALAVDTSRVDRARLFPGARNPVDLPVEPEDPADPDAGDDPVVPAEPPVRGRRRMDIDQLDRAIQQVTGGIAWEIGGANQFQALASTLGRPDYVEITQESLEPTPLFQKFLADAARSVCARLVEADLAAEPGARVLFGEVDPHATWSEAPDAVEANLRRLVLRYHGVRLAEGSDELAPWTWLFESATHVAEGDTLVAWRTVCVGLITHPAFYSY